MRRLFIILLLSMCLLTVVSAEQQSLTGNFKVGDCIRLIQTCSNCTYNNITSVLDPNSKLAATNLIMSNSGTEYNVSFCNTSIIGDYIVNGYGDPDGLKTTWSYDFSVANLGVTQTTPQAIGSAVFIVIIFALMLVCGFVGVKLFKNEYFWILGIFLAFFSVLLAVYNVWLVYEYHHVFVGATDSKLPETIFWIFLFVVIAGLLSSIALLFLHWKKVFKYIKREIKKKDEGDEDLEDWDFESWAPTMPQRG